MRYITRYLGLGIHAVIDTEIPLSVKRKQPYGDALLFSLNGSHPAEIAAKALNEIEVNESKNDKNPQNKN